MASQTITALGNAIINLVDRKTPIATANTVGMVKPDGSTINIDANGVISSNGGGGSGLEVCDIGMALYVDETKGLRRYLNGQIVDINTNTQAFLNRLQQITTLHPSLLCTEEEWQSAKTLSAFGQVGKFVFNYSGDEVVSVRIPRVVNIQGVFDLQNLGMTVSAGLPTLTTNSTGAHYHYEFNTDQGSGDGQARVTESQYPHRIGQGGYSSYIIGGSYTAPTVGRSSTSGAHSHTIAGTSNTVQPEAIQYPYFIQIATGSETEANIINEIELNNPYSLFDSKFSDHELNNLSWLKSEGQWNSGTVYVDAYNELLTEYNDAESVEETEGTVTFKRTPKGYKIALSTQETAILNKYNTDGIAWYYILDTTNTQFKLPRTKYGFEGLRTNVGDKIDESLPNITFCDINTMSGPDDWWGANNGAIVTTKRTNWSGYSTGSNILQARLVNFNASRSSSTYKDGAPVQERATQMYLYFYVGETVQNAKLIDAGRIGEQLANKADKTEIDGKWTSKNYSMINQQTITPGKTYTIDLSTALPNDNNVYECSIFINASSPTAANQQFVLIVGGSVLGMHTVSVLRAIAEGAPNQGVTNLIIPIGTDRKIQFADYIYNGGTIFQAEIIGYRKVK